MKLDLVKIVAQVVVAAAVVAWVVATAVAVAVGVGDTKSLDPLQLLLLRR